MPPRRRSPLVPKRAKPCASSQPIAPPPSTTSDGGAVCALTASRLVHTGPSTPARRRQLGQPVDRRHRRRGAGGDHHALAAACVIAPPRPAAGRRRRGRRAGRLPRTNVPPLPSSRSTATWSSQSSVASSRIRLCDRGEVGLHARACPASASTRPASASSLRRRAGSSSTGCSRSRGTRRRPAASSTPSTDAAGLGERAGHLFAARAQAEHDQVVGRRHGLTVVRGHVGTMGRCRPLRNRTPSQAALTRSTRRSAVRRPSPRWSNGSTRGSRATRCCGRSTPRTISVRGRGAAAAVPDPVLGRAVHLLGAAGASPAADAPRALPDRHRRPRRVAAPHARCARLGRTCRRLTTRRSGTTCAPPPIRCATPPADHPQIGEFSSHPPAPPLPDSRVGSSGRMAVRDRKRFPPAVVGDRRRSTRSIRAASPTPTVTAIGDLVGIRERLAVPTSTSGVEALWISPFYRSPMADGGYDVSRPVRCRPAVRDPGRVRCSARGGTPTTAFGSRSTSCPTTSPTSTSGSNRRSMTGRAAPRALGSSFGPGAGAHGELPPNNWPSVFGGPAWTRVPDGRVVPAHLRPGAAGPRLDQPGGARRVRADHAVLAGPGRRRVPHRRRARHGQAREPTRRRRLRPRADPQRSSHAQRRGPPVGPRRRARLPPAVPAAARLLPRRPDGGRRGVGRRR